MLVRRIQMTLKRKKKSKLLPLPLPWVVFQKLTVTLLLLKTTHFRQTSWRNRDGTNLKASFPKNGSHNTRRSCVSCKKTTNNHLIGFGAGLLGGSSCLLRKPSLLPMVDEAMNPRRESTTSLH